MKIIIFFLLLSCSNCSSIPLKIKNTTASKVQLKNYEPFLKGKLSGRAGDFIKASEQYKIPVKLLLAISIQETGGTSRALRTRNNAFGSMMKTKRGYKLRSFPSIAASINFTAKSLRDNYFAKNRRTVSQISFRYCPNGRAKWVKNVNSIMKKLP